MTLGYSKNPESLVPLMYIPGSKQLVTSSPNTRYLKRKLVQMTIYSD